MGLNILAEAILRVEHKLDQLLTALAPGRVHPQLGFVGINCPVCNRNVQYQIDIQHQVVKRSCGCTTGKQPSLFPLVPLPNPGAPVNANNPADQAAERDPGAEDSSKRKAR